MIVMKGDMMWMDMWMCKIMWPEYKWIMMPSVINDIIINSKRMI